WTVSEVTSFAPPKILRQSLAFRTCSYLMQKGRLALPSDNSEANIVLLIDPDEAFCQVLQPLLGQQNLLRQESSIAAAIASFDQAGPDAILLNLDATDHGQNSLLLRAAPDRSVSLPVVAYCFDGSG